MSLNVDENVEGSSTIEELEQGGSSLSSTAIPD
jgi:hypothetical protein